MGDADGLDFASCEAKFGFASAVVIPAKRGRTMMIGGLDDVVDAVVCAKLGSEAMTLISLRRASKPVANKKPQPSNSPPSGWTPKRWRPSAQLRRAGRAG